jgi:nucleotide-binding universal stress UspA family protein
VAAGLATELGASLETITVTEKEGTSAADPGDAATELVERSRELDLLVVGSRGYGPVRHALLGSVTSKLMQAAACPVLVVPRSAGN